MSYTGLNQHFPTKPVKPIPIRYKSRGVKLKKRSSSRSVSPTRPDHLSSEFRSKRRRKFVDQLPRPKSDIRIVEVQDTSWARRKCSDVVQNRALLCVETNRPSLLRSRTSTEATETPAFGSLVKSGSIGDNRRSSCSSGPRTRYRTPVDDMEEIESQNAISTPPEGTLKLTNDFKNINREIESFLSEAHVLRQSSVRAVPADSRWNKRSNSVLARRPGRRALRPELIMLEPSPQLRERSITPLRLRRSRIVNNS